VRLESTAASRVLTARRAGSTAGELTRYVAERNCYVPILYLGVSIHERDRPPYEDA